MAPTFRTDAPSDQLARCCTALKQQLRKSPYWDIRHLVCQIKRNQITVQGTVSSFYIKQIAQSVATKVAGCECVQSEIEVEPYHAASREDGEWSHGVSL